MLTINRAQSAHGLSVTYMRHGELSPVPAYRSNALHSAWVARVHTLSVGHVRPVLCRSRGGAPLYPMLTILLSLTMMAPTDRRKHVDRLATASATAMNICRRVIRITRTAI